MTKKHLITCSVMLVVIIISAFDLSNATVVKRPSVAHNATRFALIEPPEEEAAGFSFAEEVLPVNSKRVNRKINYSLWMHSYTKVQSNILHIKAEKLFPVIVPILEEYGIPEDFKYLPLVESGLREGTSRKGARGSWQFMPGTARSYGLKVNKKKDERLNLRKSTIAACKYLNDLYAEFGSWTLAAAAYNNGSIKLEKAMHRQNEDNYFRMHLNRETGMYVYKLVAIKEVIENPGKYGYKEFYAQIYNHTNLMAFN
ncbi:lytic transglycosylase domain-containing protein [Mucilaginibacter roseus]|uniref:Lytic transglycosylase domain-containing protein n=1 Tax=Mucilaginibacter roseus TaxID=1528868 RepID=A0ABS8U5Z5_9SPHI|nr:lytic transglycosylase domain-containing protein [Mucilaginibacter roseus]MCD8742534.1 lytic transglycosylase domain-containing protein [Mucilaginibacter roseus]